MEEGENGVVLKGFTTVNERESFLSGDVVGAVGDRGGRYIVVEWVGIAAVEV